MSFEPRDYLRHILIEADYLLASSQGLTFEDFSAEVPEEFRTSHPDIEWSGMSGLRDRLIHGYFGVDYEIVWDVVQNHVPELRRRVASILEE